MNEFFTVVLNRFLVLLAFTVLDVLGGIYVSWKNNEFSLELLPEFLKTFVGYLLAWVTFEVLGYLPGYLGVNIGVQALELLAQYSGEVVFGLVIVKYSASLLSHVQYILGKDIKLLNAVGIVADWDVRKFEDDDPQ